MMSLKQNTFSALGWSGVTQMLRQGIIFIIGVILARLLPPEDFGLLAMVIVFTGFAQMFSELGLGAALIQKQDIEKRHIDSVFWTNICAGIVVTFTVFSLAPMISLFYDEPKLTPLVQAISFSFVFSAFAVVQRSLLRRELNFRRLMFVEVISVMLSGVLGIVFALLGFGVWSLVARQIGNIVLLASLLWISSSWRPSFYFEFRAIKEIWGFSANLLGFNTLNYWIRNLDNVLIGRFIGSSALGFYSMAYQLMLLPVNQVSMIISSVMFPALSKIQNKPDKVKEIYLRAIGAIAFITIPLMLGLLAVSESFVLTVFGNKWSPIIPILQIFCILGAIQSIGTTKGWIFNSQGRTDIQFRLGFLSAFVRGIAFIIGLRWGVIGVASAYALSGFFLMYPNWYLAGKLVSMKPIEVLNALKGIIFCCLIMLLSLYILGFFVDALSAPLELVIQTLFGMFIYFVAIYTIEPKPYIDFKQLIREYLSDNNRMNKVPLFIQKVIQ